jgi:hypothetical protein
MDAVKMSKMASWMIASLIDSICHIKKKHKKRPLFVKEM